MVVGGEVAGVRGRPHDDMFFELSELSSRIVSSTATKPRQGKRSDVGHPELRPRTKPRQDKRSDVVGHPELRPSSHNAKTKGLM